AGGGEERQREGRDEGGEDLRGTAQLPLRGPCGPACYARKQPYSSSSGQPFGTGANASAPPPTAHPPPAREGPTGGVTRWLRSFSWSSWSAPPCTRSASTTASSAGATPTRTRSRRSTSSCPAATT